MVFHYQTISGAPGDSCAAPCHAEPCVLTRSAISEPRSVSVEKLEQYEAFLITEVQQPVSPMATENTWQSEGEEEALGGAAVLMNLQTARTRGEVAMKQGMVTMVKVLRGAL